VRPGVFERALPHALAGALCAGIACALAVRAGSIAVGFGACAVAVAACVVPQRWRLPLILGSLALIGWWWGSIRLEALDRSVLIREVGQARRTRVVVTGAARVGEFGLRVPVQVRRFGTLLVRERALLELPLARSPPQGAVLELITKVELPRSDGGSFDERAWLRRQGVHVVLDGERWRLVARRGGLSGVADRLRAHIERALAAGARGERRAVLAGVVIGADEGLSDELRDSFRASGLYHLLAVSGQNVALIAGGVLLLAWLFGAPRLAAETFVLAAIAGYVLAVGWQPSVVRAGVAGLLASLAWLAARPRDRWYFLLLGALVLLAWNPNSLLEPGFQLSFAAVASIFVIVPYLERRLDGYPVPRAVRGVVAVSLACGVATAPILLFHFDSVPAYSIASNAAAAPVAAPMLGLGLLAAALEALVPGAAAALGWVNGWLAAYLAGCARLFADLPYAQVSARGLLLIVGAAAAVVWLARLRAPRGARVAVVAVLALLVVAGLRLRGDDGLPPPKGLRLIALDVGQGDAILLQTRAGGVLVDQGPPEGRVARQLRRLGVRRLSLLVLTHPQRDHVGGAAEVLRRLDVRTVLDPGLASDSPDERAALAEARRRRVPVVIARSGRRFRLGRLVLRVLWPDGPGVPGADPNTRAIVLVVSYGQFDALLTADAEADVTAPLRPPPVEVLKVAHHGSADGMLPALLLSVRPRVALISVGADNDYGHPAPSTIATLSAARGVALYRTDRDGMVIVETDGRRFSVDDER
jgi:competence protein ComEC